MIESTFFKDEENELSSVSDEMFYMFFFLFEKLWKTCSSTI